MLIEPGIPCIIIRRSWFNGELFASMIADSPWQLTLRCVEYVERSNLTLIMKIPLSTFPAGLVKCTSVYCTCLLRFCTPPPFLPLLLRTVDSHNILILPISSCHPLDAFGRYIELYGLFIWFIHINTKTNMQLHCNS